MSSAIVGGIKSRRSKKGTYLHFIEIKTNVIHHFLKIYNIKQLEISFPFMTGTF